MMKVLTIGIPVYNMEKYLDRCLQSVTSIKNPDACEIIVVNDGSKDRSLEIARTYEKANPGLLRVIDKKNGGWGSAINESIRAATGKYYKSLDSDDWFDTLNLDDYIQQLVSVDADMVLTPFNEVDEHGDLLEERRFGYEFANKYLEIGNYMTQNKGLYNPIHAVTYRTSILQDNHIHIWEKFYGDLDYINAPLSFVKTIYVSTHCIYQYMRGREGQSISIKGYRAHLDDYLSVSKKLISSCNKKGVHVALQQHLFNDSVGRAVWAYKLLMNPAFCGNMKDSASKLTEFDSFLKKNHPDIYVAAGKHKSKYGFSPVSLWRKTNLNIYKILRPFLRLL